MLYQEICYSFSLIWSFSYKTWESENVRFFSIDKYRYCKDCGKSDIIQFLWIEICLTVWCMWCIVFYCLLQFSIYLLSSLYNNFYTDLSHLGQNHLLIDFIKTNFPIVLTSQIWAIWLANIKTDFAITPSKRLGH